MGLWKSLFSKRELGEEEIEQVEDLLFLTRITPSFLGIKSYVQQCRDIARGTKQEEWVSRQVFETVAAKVTDAAIRTDQPSLEKAIESIIFTLGATLDRYDQNELQTLACAYGHLQTLTGIAMSARNAEKEDEVLALYADKLEKYQRRFPGSATPIVLHADLFAPLALQIKYHPFESTEDQLPRTTSGLLYRNLLARKLDQLDHNLKNRPVYVLAHQAGDIEAQFTKLATYLAASEYEAKESETVQGAISKRRQLFDKKKDEGRKEIVAAEAEHDRLFDAYREAQDVPSAFKLLQALMACTAKYGPCLEIDDSSEFLAGQVKLLTEKGAQVELVGKNQYVVRQGEFEGKLGFFNFRA